ncbi:hypothetical protein H072_892 [Dactylellina haptotyla CBS 200.50]|uniref:ribonuclease H n=1 Tax=Dactylellina haptotyla (strain CBS 200.50) TaxID=1284197 RepID=S8AVX5_DACHA|nr:hypothetical protein H072_892 [Dactylellina haptotyla CBS 200.50]
MGSRAGVGVAFGADDEHQVSKAFTSLDFGGVDSKRTSQIAELRAALEAINTINRFYDDYRPGTETAPGSLKRKKLHQHLDDREPMNWIIAMDSEYVVRGVTEWLPKWRENGFVNSQGTTPANLNLFLHLDAAISSVEDGRKIQVFFWKIPRDSDSIADKLAKAAAQLDTPTH